ncbi:Pinin [Ananas comosus]|uniref:Pinin n=1 Tax=Ananas comosus TaxID=4615 RepID=A0A199UD70_ANACO|nr:Pinin [Ananas comosus]
MASSVVEKTVEELRKEIQELHRQQREISERLRDPRGLRRSGVASGSPRPIGGGPRTRSLIRPAVAAESEYQPPPKRRLLSTVVKTDGEEDKVDDSGTKDEKELIVEEEADVFGGKNSKPAASNAHGNGRLRRDGNLQSRKIDYDIPPPEPLPRVFPKDEDPKLVKRNRRMLGQLLGTLEKFREEDKQLSSTEAFMRRSDSLRRILRARVAAKAEQKRLELLFIIWAEHHKKLSNYIRTKAEPPIYYMPAKPLIDDMTITEQQKEQVLLEWKSARRAELSEFQKQIEEQYVTNVEKELERWQNARNARRANNAANLQETMDKELETHRLEHGPKTRRIPGDDDDEDVEDIAAEDELIDEVLDVAERIDTDAPPKLFPAGNGSPIQTELQ